VILQAFSLSLPLGESLLSVRHPRCRPGRPRPLETLLASRTQTHPLRCPPQVAAATKPPPLEPFSAAKQLTRLPLPSKTPLSPPLSPKNWRKPSSPSDTLAAAHDETGRSRCLLASRTPHPSASSPAASPRRYATSITRNLLRSKTIGTPPTATQDTPATKEWGETLLSAQSRYTKQKTTNNNPRSRKTERSRNRYRSWGIETEIQSKNNRKDERQKMKEHSGNFYSSRHLCHQRIGGNSPPVGHPRCRS
jgi:hypothetical protein